MPRPFSWGGKKKKKKKELNNSVLAREADMPASHAPSMLLALLALGLHEATCFQTGAFRFGGLRGSNRAPTMAIHQAAPHNAAQISRRAASLLAISFFPAFASVAHAREDSIVTFKKEIAGGDGSFSAPLSAHFIIVFFLRDSCV
jgi:hypothetical protein